MVALKIAAIGLIILVAAVYENGGMIESEIPLHEPSDIWNLSGDELIDQHFWCNETNSIRNEGETCGPSSPKPTPPPHVTEESIRFKRAKKKEETGKLLHLHLDYKCCKVKVIATLKTTSVLVCGRNRASDPYTCLKSPKRRPGNVNLPHAQHHQHPQHPHQA